jgi:hypothetical protein
MLGETSVARTDQDLRAEHSERDGQGIRTKPSSMS